MGITSLLLLESSLCQDVPRLIAVTSVQLFFWIGLLSGFPMLAALYIRC